MGLSQGSWDEEVILDGPETSVLMRDTQRTRQTQERRSWRQGQRLEQCRHEPKGCPGPLETGKGKERILPWIKPSEGTRPWPHLDFSLRKCGGKFSAICYPSLGKLVQSLSPWERRARLFFFLVCIYLAIPVLVAASGIFNVLCSIWLFSCGTRTLSCDTWDLVSWPGIEPGAPCIGSMES